MITTVRALPPTVPPLSSPTTRPSDAPGQRTTVLADLRLRATSLEFPTYVHGAGDSDDCDLIRISADGVPVCWGPMTFLRYGSHTWRWFEGGGYRQRGQAFSWRALRLFAEVTCAADPESKAITVMRSRDVATAPLRRCLLDAGASIHTAIYERRPTPLPRRLACDNRSRIDDKPLSVALDDYTVGRSAQFAYVDGTRVIAKRYAEGVGSYEMPLESVWCFPSETSTAVDCCSIFGAASQWNPNLRGTFLFGDRPNESATHEVALISMRDLARSLA